MENKNYCVYMHTNKINGKKYIGQTCRPLKRRFGNNGSYYFGSTYFYHAIQKFGWDNFEHEVLKTGLNKQEANFYEIKYIKEFDTMNPEKGYNLNSGGGSEREVSEQTKQRMRENHADFRGENHPRYGKKLTQETKDKISRSLMGKYKGEKHPCYGSHISEEQKEFLRIYASTHYKGKGNPKAKAVLQYDSKGNFIREWDYIKQAADELKIGKVAISFCCKGKQKQAGGYIWKYK